MSWGAGSARQGGSPVAALAAHAAFQAWSRGLLSVSSRPGLSVVLWFLLAPRFPVSLISSVLPSLSLSLSSVFLQEFSALAYTFLSYPKRNPTSFGVG